MTRKLVECGAKQSWSEQRGIHVDSTKCCLPAVVEALEEMLELFPSCLCDKCQNSRIKARAALAQAYGEKV